MKIKNVNLSFRRVSRLGRVEYEEYIYMRFQNCYRSTSRRAIGIRISFFT